MRAGVESLHITESPGLAKVTGASPRLSGEKRGLSVPCLCAPGAPATVLSPLVIFICLTRRCLHI